MAEQHLDSSSSSSTHSDDALKLFVSAPWWLYCTSWKLAKPENVGTESCTFKVTGPVSSEEMMQLYRGKRLKGSVLMVGLTQAAKDMRPGQVLPASVYRTLAHLFEMSRNGVPYTPVDCDGVKNGMSAASWARPLWTICEPSLPSGPVPKADEEDEDEATQGSTQEEGDKDADDQAEEVEDSASEGHKCPPSEEVSMAVRLLNSAPSWCYLYSHEPLKSKKTPPKTSAHMVDMFKSGCLPEWTPLLGLRQNVAHFNSLPPSLFTTLGALLTVLQAGLELQPVGLVELQRYDKFIECRNHVGSTMRAPSTDTLHGVASGSVSFNRRTPSGTQSVDGITKNLPGVATSTSNGNVKSGTANNNSNSRQPPSAGQTTMTSPSHAAWAQAASSTPGGSESPGTPGQAPYTTPESPVVAPYGMPVQQHMHVYQAMLPTWLWGVPHMPYTFMAPPGAGSPAGHPLHTLPSAPQPTITASPARRSAGSKHRSGAGNRGPVSTPGSPATTANPAAPAGAPISSPGNGAAHNNHRLAHSSAASVGGARSIITSPTSVSGALHPLGSPAASLLVAPGVPAQQHPLLINPSMMTPDAASAAMQAGLWGWPGAVPATVAAPTAAGAAGGAGAGAGAGAGSSPWQTSLFRLFMADCSRGLDVPVWWYLENKTSGTVVGPLGCEAMIMAYARGTLTEQHMVCGTHSDVTAACPPAREFFEELGGLLRQVEAGGSYVLVSQAEVTRHASLAVFSAGGSGGSLGGASNGRQSGKAGKRSNKANGLQSMGSAPIPPRTPTSTQATSPRPEGADPNSSTPAATMEIWTSSQGVPRCSPSNGRTKNSSRQSNPNTRNTTSPTQPAASFQPHAPTPADASATIVAIKAASAGVAQPTAGEQVDVDTEASRFRGLSVHVPAARDTAAAAAAATAEWVEFHDTAFTSREAVQAAAAAASMAMFAVPQAVVVVQSDVDLRGCSAGGMLGSAEQDSLTPRTIVTLGSGVQQVTVQQLRKSSRGGAPLSVKNSFEEDQTKTLMHVNGGVELRDSDDDVRGPAARDAHDSRNCSFGGATVNANGQGLVVTVAPAAAGIAPAPLA